MIQSLICLAPIAVLFLWNVKIAGIGKNFDDYMSVDNMQNIRGMLAVLIVIHHFSGMIEENSMFFLFNHIGYLVVALFLFLSGYGLAYGVQNKPGYISGVKFLYTRIPKLVIPYWIAVVIYAVGYFAAGEPNTWKEILLSFVSFKNIVGSSWYIFELIGLYIIFFLSFKIKNRKIALSVLFVLVAVCAIGFYFGDSFSDVWYRSIFAFPLGVLYSLKKDKIESFLLNKTIGKYIVLILFLIILLSLRYVCVVFDLSYLQVLFDVTSSAMFALVAVIMLRKIKLGNKALGFLGSLSFEIYLVHFLLLKLIYSLYFNGQINLLLYFVISIVSIILAAYIMNFIDRSLTKLYMKAITK